MAFHSGFVCIIGRPNAGKSTLLNALVGQKLAIVSPKPQTTRNRILGIIQVPKQKGRPAGQVILIDTPGIHHSGSALGRNMMREVRQALAGCNLLLMIVDATRPPDDEDGFALSLLKRAGIPAFLLLNKIDLIRGGKSGSKNGGKNNKDKLLPLIAKYAGLYPFDQIIPISARKREGLDLLLQQIMEKLPEGPRFFPEDQITDQPLRFMAAEIIREQILLQTREEVPHSTGVLIEQFEEGKKLVRIAAMIYCDRVGQKAILLGKQGQMLKQIGTAARLEIEKMIASKVFLQLFIKVQPGWRDSQKVVQELDWRSELKN